MLGAIGSVLKALDLRPDNPKKLAASLQDEASKGSDFESLLKGILVPDQGNNVNEEELFSAIVSERIASLKDQPTADEFKTILDKEKQALKKPNGYVPVEEATVNALKKFVADGKITAEEGDSIYSSSFAAAQLDDNKDCLYDSIGGKGDPTMAMAALEVAMSGAKTLIDKFTAGEETAAARSLASASATGVAGQGGPSVSPSLAGPAVLGGTETVTPNGTYVDGEKGFLWKPVTNSDGKLAVLLPAAMTEQVLSVIVKDSQGNTVEEGRRQPAGISETGQEKFSFSKPGGSYPKDVTVEVTLADGTVKTYKIPDPSKRYD